MRSISLALLVTAILFSCNSSDSDKKPDGSDSPNAVNPSGNTGPRTITDAILDLKTILESKNRNSIAELMDFPLEDTVMNVYIDDSVFQKSYKAAGNKLSKPLFMQYYDTISKFTYLDQVTEIFKLVPLDSLKYKNELTKEFKDKNEPCMKKYKIEVEQDIVRLVYGTDTNDEYVKKGIAQDEESEDAGCEYSVFWIFRFDGNKLKLLHQGAAG
jgi:hypothetical protein